VAGLVSQRQGRKEKTRTRFGGVKTFSDFRIELPHGASGECDVLCPECSATRKKKHVRCLGVNVEKGTWLCQHCGYSGGLLQGAHERREDHWRKPVYVRPVPREAPDDLDVALVQYMAARSIPAKVLRRNKISLQTVYMPQVENRVKAVCFPYYRGEEFINAKYRDREKNFRMEAGAERILYGLNDIAAHCVIVEGEMDKLSVEVAGITACVSVPDGAPALNAKNYASKFTFLDADADALEIVQEWVIAVDNDEPGLRLEQELVRRFGAEKCRHVTWPTDCKDANDVLMKHGADALRKCIADAKPYPLSGVVEVSSIAREIDQLYEEGERPGLSTGWKNLDEYYTVRPGELTVVTGIPNSGKSNWVDSLMVNLCREHAWSFAVFSPENQPIANHVSRLMEKVARKPFRPGPTQRMSREQMAEVRECIGFHFSFILPEDDEDWTVDHILQSAAALVRRKGIRGIVIDPWNELEHMRPDRMTETEYTSHCLKRIRQFARKHQVHVWIIAHPAKMYRDKDGKYPVPTLYDVSGSAHFRNKADNGVVVWRNITEPSEPVEVHVQKIRFREVGKLGVCKFKYDHVLADYAPFGVLRAVDPWSPA
jgi:twinkle protein